MDPILLATSVNLASKVLPEAWNALTQPAQTQQILPSEAARFDQILSKKISASEPTSPLMQSLLQVPELQSISTQNPDWPNSTLEIQANGNLTLIHPDQSRAQIQLTPESRGQLQQIYQQNLQEQPLALSSPLQAKPSLFIQPLPQGHKLHWARPNPAPV